MPGNDLDLLIQGAKAAGDIATPYWQQSPQTWEKDAGAGPVTEADLAVDAMLKSSLIAARPDYGWLSEETEDDTARLSKDRVFIVDPIDGTRSFIAGERTWAHSLAIAEFGHVIAAVVYLPLRDKLYSAVKGQGAYLNGEPIRQSGCKALDHSNILSAQPNFDIQYWPRGVPIVNRHFRTSLAYRLSLVAEGRFDAMLTFRDTWEWDVAAGSLIATEAGATVTDGLGNSPLFNNPRPMLPGMLAACTDVHRDLCARLH